MSPQAKHPGGIETVAVIGAGTIGASWAALFLARGLEVDVYDPSDEAERYVGDYLETAWPSLEKLGLTQTAAPRKPSFFATPEEAVRRAQFVQESVPERLDVKHDVYRRIEPQLAPEAIVASSASGLLVREMQVGWSDPGRFILAHPFNPPHLIPLVELLANQRTAEGVLDRAERFYGACGKVTIGEMNWGSAQVIANVEKFVLEVGYGCQVEIIQTTTVPSMTSMIEKGEPDIASEIWINSVKEVFEKGVRDALAALDRRRIRYRIEGFMWHQGENDMFNEGYLANYGKNLANFVACWRRDLDVPDLRFYIGELCTKTIWGMDLRPRMYAISLGQREVTEADPRAEFIPTSHVGVEIGGGMW